MKKITILASAILFMFSACKEDDPIDPKPLPSHTDNLYFPPIGSDTWERTSPETLGYDTSKIEALYSFLDDGKTRGFLLLKDGKIVLEHYAGKDLINVTDFDANTNWYWASAGKTLTSFLVGKAQEDNYLKIADKTSKYLGKWSDLTQEQEDKILKFHNAILITLIETNIIS